MTTRNIITSVFATMLVFSLVAGATSTSQAGVISGVTYRYDAGTNAADVTTCCGAPPIDEDLRIGAFGDGILNNGIIGNTAYHANPASLRWFRW